MHTNRLTWRRVPQSPDIFHVYHLRRSGGHGVIDWLFGHHAGPKTHYNQCLVKPDGSLQVAKEWIRTYDGAAGTRAMELASFEDTPLTAMRRWRRPPGSAVLLLRDPYNMYASRLQMSRRHAEFDAHGHGRAVRIDPQAWKQYAREFLQPQLVTYAVRINFNRWYTDADYRRGLSHELGWEHSDLGFASRRGWEFSHGSSFGEIDAAQLDLFNRWREFRDDEEFLELIDDETRTLSQQIFGFAPDLPRRAQATGASLAKPISPAEAQQLLNRALGHHQAGRLDDAETIYRKLLASQPNHADANHLLGIIAHQTGRAEEALERIDRALRETPQQAIFHNSRGVALKQLGRLEEAVSAFRRALQYQTVYADAANNLGVTLIDLQRFDDAADCYRQALRLQPDYAEAYNNMGVALMLAGRGLEAVDAYREAIRLKPDYAEALNNLGIMLNERKQSVEALDCFSRALALRPPYAEAHNNQGVALRELGRLDEAAVSYRRALEFSPNYAEAHHNLGSVCRLQGQLNESIQRYERALEIQPQYADAHLSRALHWLQVGDYERGWTEFEWRWQSKHLKRSQREWTAPRWDGAPLPGQTLLVFAEQGHGDTIQFARFLKAARQCVGRLVLECQPGLVRWMSRLPEVDHVVARGDALPAYDAQVPLMSLPLLLGLRLDQLPVAHNYLPVAEVDRTEIRAQLAAHSGLRVGICWQGNPEYPDDLFRHVKLAEFAPLTRIPGVQLFSLQKGYGEEQLAAFAERDRIVDLAPQLHDFYDTAAAVSDMDLIITSCSALAHVAGALDRPTWIALSNPADWRWLLHRDDSPWYPTVRLFRQQKLLDWQPVFARIADELPRYAARVASSSHPGP